MPKPLPCGAVVADAGDEPGDLITGPMQMEYNGLLLGKTTPYSTGATLTGWDSLPPLTNASTARPAQHGSFPGRLLAQSRVVEFTDGLVHARRDKFGDCLKVLRSRLGLLDDTTAALVVSEPDGTALLAWARVTARDIPRRTPHRSFGAEKLSVQWEANDPYRYGLELKSLTMRPAVVVGQLDWGDPAKQQIVDPEFDDGDLQATLWNAESAWEWNAQSRPDNVYWKAHADVDSGTWRSLTYDQELNAEAGETWTVEAEVSTNNNTGTAGYFAVRLICLDSSGTQIAYRTPISVSEADAPRQVYTGTRTLPAGTAKVRVVCAINGDFNTPGDVVYLQSLRVTRPVRYEGLSWPLDWGYVDYGDRTAVNDGDVDAPAVVEFHGPAENYAIINADQQRLGFTLPLTGTDVLTVDTYEGTVILNGTVSREDALDGASAPPAEWRIPVGTSALAYASNHSGSVTATWRDTYL